MGIFSKKTLVCEKCGKEYEARVTFLRTLCDECRKRLKEKEAIVNGYVTYGLDVGLDLYSEDQLDEILAHRDRILDKCRAECGISKDELIDASCNYKRLSDDEAQSIVARAYDSSIIADLGAAYVPKLFIPTGYEKVVVDVEDVFAVAYTSDHGLGNTKTEVIVSVLFTNDPYVPVFAMVCLAKYGPFDILKSKKGHQYVEAFYESMCPNLTYPIQDIKKLKKQIKSEGMVRGNIKAEFMFDKILQASGCSGIFNAKKMESKLDYQTTKMLEEYGYLPEEVVSDILKLDKIFNRKFWEKQLNNIWEGK